MAGSEVRDTTLNTLLHHLQTELTPSLQLSGLVFVCFYLAFESLSRSFTKNANSEKLFWHPSLLLFIAPWHRLCILLGFDDILLFGIAYGPTGASLVAQMVKNLPVLQETQVQSLGQEDTLEKEMATLAIPSSSILAWKIPWLEKPGGL